MIDLSTLRSKGYATGRELNRLYHRRLYSRGYNPTGVDIFEEDWDNMILLDACRFDVFAEEADLPGDLQKRYSRGTTTKEFVKANFVNQKLHDVVYVTGNSWYLRLREALNSEVHAVYNPTDRDPSAVTDKVQTVREEYPKKRLLIHYIPPHHPFAGPTADEHLPSYTDQQDGLYSKIRRGELDVDDDTLRRAYRENLHRVLPEVETLLEQLDGKTIVSADHGELLGDRCSPLPIREYGHHLGLYVDQLVEVPWLVHENGDRRTIRADEPTTQAEETVDETEIDQRLRDLGYKV